MKIAIQYNQQTDEFTNDKSLEMRLENYIKKYFPIAYTISTLAPIYLVGGSIRDLIFAKNPKDLDFIILGNEYSQVVLNTLQQFHINFTFNRFGGYKINYHGTSVDLWTNDDLYSAIQYNIDGLFFNLNTNSLLSFTFNDFVKNGLKLINPNNNIERGREKKLIQFEKKYRNSTKSF